MANMTVMIIRDHEENPNAIGAPGDSLAVLEKIVESPYLRVPYSCNQTGVINARVTEWAWEHDYQSLYFKSVLSSMTRTGGSEGMEAVAKIINADISEASDKTALHWDE